MYDPRRGSKAAATAANSGYERKSDAAEMSPKPKKRGWGAQEEKAARALAANKARIEAAHSSGLASDKTLGQRDYDASPDGGGKKVPRQIAGSPPRKRKRRRRRRSQTGGDG